MENLLPFIIGAIVLAAKAYSNFQKEQEKARKRDPGQKPVGEVVEEVERRPVSRPRREVADPFLPEPTAVPSAYEAYSGALHEVEEVRRTREIHKKHAHSFKRLEPYRAEITKASTEGFISAEDFDLRDAVIKSAILNRPYAD